MTTPPGWRCGSSASRFEDESTPRARPKHARKRGRPSTGSRLAPCWRARVAALKTSRHTTGQAGGTRPAVEAPRGLVVDIDRRP